MIGLAGAYLTTTQNRDTRNGIGILQQRERERQNVQAGTILNPANRR